VRNALGDSPVWSVLLPDDTIRLPGRGRRARRLHRVVAAVPQGRTWAIAGPPWSHRHNVHRAAKSDADVVHTYVTYPRDRPIVIASKDPVVLRYVATSVLSVPPGAGRIPSMVFTSGLRLLRLPMMWTLAAVVRAAGTVLVGRST
jgi:hypothetical protein